MHIATEVGKRIRIYRKQKEMTQEQLAELCGFHPTYIGQLERGEKNATIDSLSRITQGLGISLSKFLENMDALPEKQDNIPQQIYQQLLALSKEQQHDVQIILNDIISLLKNNL